MNKIKDLVYGLMIKLGLVKVCPIKVINEKSIYK